MNAGTTPVLFPSAFGGAGMLGALRDLGRSGVPVLAPQLPWMSPLRSSKFLTAQVANLPGALSLSAQFDWLLKVGQERPRSALMPGLDGLTWLAAERQAELQKWYQLYSPGGDTVYTLLNKERLHRAAQAAGLKTPRAWFPASLREVDILAPGLPYPLLVKPRTHIGADFWFKGIRVRGPDELRRVYSRMTHAAVDNMVLARDPMARFPFIQAYHAGAASAVYNLCGFITEDRELAAFDASWKVPQQPRRLGIGVCFEAAPVDQDLAGQIRELARQTGFFGMFEAEFIQVDGEFLLIDFNPRVFNSIAFPAARGLRLAWLWYQSAMGNHAEVAEEIQRFNSAGPPTGAPERWCHRFALETMVAARLLTFRMSPREAWRWWGWVHDSRARTMDAIGDAGDPWPGRVNALQHFARFVRDPRMFAGTFVRD